jgi:hypothetical protein
VKQTYNPGSFQVRLGTSLSLYETAIAAGDLATANNILGVLEAYASVHLTKKELGELAKLPTFSYGDERDTGTVFSDMNRRLSYLLTALRDHNKFDRATIEVGTTDELDT